jgi:hypothetical protein
MSEYQMKIAYVITKRGARSYWTRIGVAFTNRDGSINVKLDAIPVNGEIQLRDFVPYEGDTPTDLSASDKVDAGEGEIPF